MKKTEKNKLLVLVFCLLYCNFLFSQENLEQIDSETYLKITTEAIYCFGEGCAINIKEAQKLAFDNLKSKFTDVKDDAEKHVKYTIVESYGGNEVVVFCYMLKNNNNETSGTIEQSKTTTETKVITQNSRTETMIPISKEEKQFVVETTKTEVKQQANDNTIEIRHVSTISQNFTVETLKNLNNDFDSFRKQIVRMSRTDGQLFYSDYQPADPENYMMAVFQNNFLFKFLNVGTNSRKDLLTDKTVPTSAFNLYINNQNYKILWIQIPQNQE